MLLLTLSDSAYLKLLELRDLETAKFVQCAATFLKQTTSTTVKYLC